MHLSLGIVTLDLHGKNTYQARVSVDAALRRVDRSVYRLHIVHGHHAGTSLRELIRSEYSDHPRVLRLEAAGDGATDLVLREL